MDKVSRQRRSLARGLRRHSTLNSSDSGRRSSSWRSSWLSVAWRDENDLLRVKVQNHDEFGAYMNSGIDFLFSWFDEWVHVACDRLLVVRDLRIPAWVHHDNLGGTRGGLTSSSYCFSRIMRTASVHHEIRNDTGSKRLFTRLEIGRLASFSTITYTFQHESLLRNR